MLARPSRLEALDAASDVLHAPILTATALGGGIALGSAFLIVVGLAVGVTFAIAAHLGRYDEAADDVRAFLGLPLRPVLDDEEA